MLLDAAGQQHMWFQIIRPDNKLYNPNMGFCRVMRWDAEFWFLLNLGYFTVLAD